MKVLNTNAHISYTGNHTHKRMHKPLPFSFYPIISKNYIYGFLYQKINICRKHKILFSAEFLIELSTELNYNF
jgi:hypothetical protein